MATYTSTEIKDATGLSRSWTLPVRRAGGRSERHQARKSLRESEAVEFAGSELPMGGAGAGASLSGLLWGYKKDAARLLFDKSRSPWHSRT